MRAKCQFPYARYSYCEFHLFLLGMMQITIVRIEKKKKKNAIFHKLYTRAQKKKSIILLVVNTDVLYAVRTWIRVCHIVRLNRLINSRSFYLVFVCIDQTFIRWDYIKRAIEKIGQQTVPVVSIANGNDLFSIASVSELNSFVGKAKESC